MAEIHATSSPSPGRRTPSILGQLGAVCDAQGLAPLAERLADLADLTRGDLGACEDAIAVLERGGSLVARSAAHLLDLGGKRLRPLCVALAARLGTGFSPAARDLAVAVELVHGATLLHDDVVDLGDVRRGAPAARVLYGNAASIFAGDWLLVAALRRVRRASVPGLMERLLDVIESMIFAESEQLERRGGLRADRAAYFRIVEGKTASLFRWALGAGGRAGGLGDGDCAALEDYGRHLGIAFQAIDDLLDLRGDPAALGKGLFADVREGKMTYPLIVALERRPELGPLVLAAAETPGPLLGALTEVGAVEATLELAREHAGRARAAIEGLPAGRARRALETVADAAVARDR